MSINIISRNVGSDVSIGGSAGIKVTMPKGSPFSPLDLSPVIWLDATQLGLANGAPVNNFTDESGNGNTFMDTGSPATYALPGINGLGAVNNPTSSDLTLASFGAAAAWWSAIVIKPVTLAGGQIIWGIVSFPANGTDYKLLSTNSATSVNINQPSGGGSSLDNSPVVANGTPTAFFLTGSPTLMTMLSDAGTLGQRTFTGIGSDSGSKVSALSRLFCFDNGSAQFIGMIGELIYGTGTLTAIQQKQLWKYLTRWGTLNPDP